ncbi:MULTISPECIES: hypothetical protein [unclassified Ensifer]|uniref:hypothetical protein n=1 Tax=unclassified Ensifer TaxID=2633371 RepID=UPI00070F4093|nr:MULTISPECIES: hypothetical protein [unclassified Ensifer]KQW39747.1 hypothetical protein ASD02_15345 [Ensifer sp. Root1252]KRC60151.1 hypothetical protein ASE32_14075 [Ensifer sp. Root231]KRC90645.1 hypothetical protein ASE47_12435 [Ensifer sp. Root258]
MTPPTELAAIRNLATAAHLFVEPIWLEWNSAWNGDAPVTPSQWTCGRTSLFLSRALAAEGFEASWASGTPRLSSSGPELGDFGFLSDAGWQSHAWVECGNVIVDITADQFGAPPVHIVDRYDRRYSKGDRDTALPEFIRACQRAVDEIWPRWRCNSRKPSTLIPEMFAYTAE